MAGKGRVPKLPGNRRTNRTPGLGEWQAAPGVGWQHGPIPAAPRGLLPASVDAWTAWMQAWWAAHWIPGDLPVLELVIGVFDQVERGVASGALRGELRLLMDNYGITPKGRQDRRWLEPAGEQPKATAAKTEQGDNPYTHLKVIR